MENAALRVHKTVTTPDQKYNYRTTALQLETKGQVLEEGLLDLEA